MARFKREIHLARKVTHPNVCRVFDVAHHRLPAPGADGEQTVIFLTMELLFGETLANRLLRTGPLSLEEARPLIRQMAAGLEAAHRAGVVHRDFKPDNLVLMPPREPGSELRVVVTDFGLACGSGASDSFAASVSQTGDIIGSPAYMAPEQVEGAEVNAAADLYALGVVMFEMATSALPFGSSCSLGTAIKRLKEPAPAPRSLADDLDPRWQ